MVLAFLSYFRISFILFALPFILFPKKLFNIGMWLFIWVAFLVGSSFLLWYKDSWHDYYYSMREWSSSQLVWWLSKIDNSFSWKYPAIIENTTNLTSASPYLCTNCSIQYLLKFTSGINISSVWLLFIYCLLSLSLLSLFKRQLMNSDIKLFLFWTFLFVLFDYFIPAPRFCYNYIQWLIPIWIILQNNYWKNKKDLIFFVLLGLLLNRYIVTNSIIHPFIFWYLGELLIVLFVIKKLWKHWIEMHE